MSIVVTLLMLHVCNLATTKSRGALTFDVTDKRKVITKNIDRDLLLRVEKVGSGWDVKAVRKPYNPNSSHNLLYHSREWHGPYPSQVEAWQVTERYFPNVRELNVRGYSYLVKIALINPIVENGGFVSGTIRISWKRKS